MSKSQEGTSQRLLGSRAPESTDDQLLWKSSLDFEADSWLSDHIFFGSKTFPLAGYVAIAGECMRQLSDSKLESFSVRDFFIKSALVLNSDVTTELHTKVRPQSLEVGKAQWYEIEIASKVGDQSTELCTGRVSREVNVDPAVLQDVTQDGSCPKPVSANYWYDMIADRGINYGDSQRGLGEISTSYTEQKARATIVPAINPTDSGIHPTVIEQCLQISLIATCKGQGRLLADLPIITSIYHLTISNNPWTKLNVTGVVHPSRSMDSACSLGAVSEEGAPVLMAQCTLSPISNINRENYFSFINWETDATCHDPNKSLGPFQPELDPTIVLERLALLYALRSEDIGASTQAYCKKLLKTIGAKRKGKFGLITDVSPFAESEPSARKTLIHMLKTQIDDTLLSAAGNALEDCLTTDNPFQGSEDDKQALLDQLHPLIRDGTLSGTLRRLGHKNPKLKVLEIGSGATNCTGLVLKALRTQFDEPLYSSYTSAASSKEAAAALKERYDGHNNVQTMFFDPKKSLEDQQLKAGTFDLIVITDFAALSSKASTGAKYLKQLLHPQGTALLLEGVPEPEWLSLVKEYLTQESKRETSLTDMYAALTKSGFVFDGQDAQTTTTSKVFATQKQTAPEKSSEITIVGPAYQLPLVREVEKTFGESNIKTTKTTLDGDIPATQDIMVFVDFDEPYLYNITEAELSRLVKLVSGMKGKMIWVTPSAQVSCKNPNSSMILGLMRTMRSEFKKDITIVELESKRAVNVSLSKSLLRIYQGLSLRAKSKDIEFDYEYAIVDGEVKIPRIQWTTAAAEYAHLAASSSEDVSICRDASSSGDVPGSIQFRPNCCYLLVGGLGGLGKMISTWMVENGARNIIFFSRSAKESPENTPFFDELRAQGCKVTPFAGSVNKLQDVEEVVKQASAPIAGVIQMSAVMRDNLMSQMSFEEWQTSVTPKVQGTWNLHHATANEKLDHFLLFSSICGITGQWGQGNYNSANSFLDAFVNYRHGQNLPASVVDIGFMGSIGMAVESEALMKNLKGSGYYFLNERHLIDALTLAFAHSKPAGDKLMHRSQLQLGIRSSMAMTTPKCRVAWKKDARMAISQHFGPIGITGDEAVKSVLDRTYGKRED